jgi:hypothetical protein
LFHFVSFPFLSFPFLSFPFLSFCFLSFPFVSVDELGFNSCSFSFNIFVFVFVYDSRVPRLFRRDSGTRERDSEKKRDADDGADDAHDADDAAQDTHTKKGSGCLDMCACAKVELYNI